MSAYALPSRQRTSQWRFSWRPRLAQDLPADNLLTAQLLLLTFATGIQDGTTLTAYRVLTTKQTGNALILALYAANPALLEAGRAVRDVVISFTAFLAGAVCVGAIIRRPKVRPRSRACFLAVNALGAVLTLAAALLHPPRTPHRFGADTAAALPIALLAFAGSFQLTAVSAQDVAPALNTAMLTGTLVRFARGDSSHRRNINAQRLRVLAIVCLMFGCYVGAVTQRRWGVGVALGVVAIVKAGVAGSLLMNRDAGDVGERDGRWEEEREWFER